MAWFLCSVDLTTQTDYLCSVQFKMVSLCSEKPIILHPNSRKFPNIAFKAVPKALFHPFKNDHQALVLSKPLASRRCPLLCDHRWYLKLPNTSDLPRCKPFVMVDFPDSLSTQTFPLTLACPGQFLKVDVKH